MKEKLNLSGAAQTALVKVLQAAVAQSQKCRFHPQCMHAPDTMLRIIAAGRCVYLTDCMRCAIQQFTEAHGEERDRDGLLEIYEQLFDADKDTASRILGRLN